MQLKEKLGFYLKNQFSTQQLWQTSVFFSFLILGACSQPTPSVESTLPPLIPREILFSDQNKMDLRMSPSGEFISFIAIADGVRNIWVTENGDLNQARQITFSKRDVFYEYYWSPDERFIIYQGDSGGDENFAFRSVEVETGNIQLLSIDGNVRSQLYGLSATYPDRIVLGYNQRDPRFFDLYSVDLKSGKNELLFENTAGYDRLYLDNDLQIRLARKPADNAPYYELYKIDKRQNGELFYSIGLEESRTYRILQFDQSNQVFYVLDNMDSDLLRLLAIDYQTGKKTEIAASARVDLEDVIFSPRTAQPIAYTENYLYPKQKWTGDALFQFPSIFDDQRIQIIDLTNDEQKALVRVSGKKPGRYYLLDKDANHQLIHAEREMLQAMDFSDPKPVVIKTRDGYDMVSYLTLPPGSDQNQDGIPDQPLPLIINPHDGPWRRVSYGFDSFWLWLANRGYAVLSPNFRGSTGFGKAFMNAGNMEWGRKMQDDLNDARAWAIDQGITEADRVGMYGMSYSGYTSLMALARDSDKYACAVDGFGASNLETLLNSLPKYWMVEFEEIVKRMGDPRTPEGRAFLKERSPIHYVDQFKKPLLIIQGENDIRVTQQESDQIAKALKDKNVPLIYLLLKAEGHGWFQHDNSMAISGITELFFTKYLGGRFEEMTDEMEKSTIEIVEGKALLESMQQIEEK